MLLYWIHFTFGDLQHCNLFRWKRTLKDVCLRVHVRVRVLQCACRDDVEEATNFQKMWCIFRMQCMPWPWSLKWNYFDVHSTNRHMHRNTHSILETTTFSTECSGFFFFDVTQSSSILYNMKIAFVMEKLSRKSISMDNRSITNRIVNNKCNHN